MILGSRSVALAFVAVLLSACGGGGGGGDEAAAIVTALLGPTPAVTSTIPANGATGVALTSPVSATASVPIAQATLNATSFTLVPTLGGPAVTGTIAVSGNTATFTPGLVLAPGTQYTATITSAVTDPAGNVLAPTNLSWSFTTVTVPGAPTIGPAIGGDSAATVRFTAPASDGGAAIEEYTVTSNPDGITASFVVAPPGSPPPPGGVVVTGLSNGTSYTFTVTATNSIGIGLPSAPSNSVTPALGAAVPGAPTFVAPVQTSTAGIGQATVRFNPPAFLGVPATIDSYTVTALVAGVPTGITASGGGSPIVVTGLTNGTTYTFEVVAFNTTGPGPAASTGPLTPAGLPSAPTAVNAASSAPVGSTVGQTVGQATVTFSAPVSNGGSAITGYTVASIPAGGIDSAPGSLSQNRLITGLSVLTPYTFTVTATNGVGTGAAGTSNGTTPTPSVVAPDAPAAPIVAAPGNAQATVGFTPLLAAPGVPGDGGSPISAYTVTAFLNAAGTIQPVPAITASGGGSSIVVPGLTNGTAYAFRVTATNAVGTGPASPVSNMVTPRTVPGAPVTVSATAGISSADVSFGAPVSNGGSAILDYTVTSNPGNISVTGAGPSITVPGLTPGTLYNFTVTARNIAGSGPAATSNNVTPTTGTAPDAPTGVSATAANAQATVTFSAPASAGGTGITGYTVTALIAGVPTGISASSAGSIPPPGGIIVNGLTNGTPYTFRVTASNSVGASVPSAPSNVATPATAPDAPTAISAIAGDSQATVSFTAPVNTGGAAITSYQVFVCNPSPTCSSGPTGSAPQILVTGLTNGTAYSFKVRATNSGALPAPPGVPLTSVDSALSNIVSPSVAAGRPSAPTGASATAGDAVATVTFGTPVSSGSSAITSYTVTSSPGGVTATFLGAVAPPGGVTVSPLVNGTTYTFTVTASNASGASTASGATNIATPATVPIAPGPVSATASAPLGSLVGQAVGQASVSFTQLLSAPNNGGAAIIANGYAVTVCSLPGPVCVAGPTGNGSPIAVSSLLVGTSYFFTVTATNAGPQPETPPGATHTGPASANSNTVTPTPATTVPSQPTGVAATAGSTVATVTFNAPASDGGSAITGYTVTSSPGGFSALLVGAAPAPVMVSGLTNGIGYTFSVIATNGVGPSLPSGPSNTATPAAAPGAPTSVGANVENGSSTVSFTPPVSTGGVPITSFTVSTYSDIAGTIPVVPAVPDVTASVPVSSIQVQGLTNGTPYTFRVTATNGGPVPATSPGALTGPLSAVSNQVTPTSAVRPDPPTGVGAVPGNGQATVTFTAPFNGGSAITGYTVTSNPSGITAFLPGAAATPVIVSGLTNGTAYTFTVTASNAVGTSDPSAASNSVTPNGAPIWTAAPVATATGSGLVSVAYTPANPNGSAITGYTVNCTGTGCVPPVGPTLANPIVVSGLTVGNSYSFRILATNAGGSTLSAPSNTTSPIATPPACSPTTPIVAGNISLRASAARPGGVAPVAVFFDASPTTSTGTGRPFHDLGYQWNFDFTNAGPPAGTWSRGSKPGVSSRNLAAGPIAAHVFETPGTYAVVLTATDGASTPTCSITITVTDPATEFSGANTLCFANGPAGTITDPPCNAPLTQKIGNTSDFIAALALAGPGKRLLFRAGDVFTTGLNPARLQAAGPGIIGSYGVFAPNGNKAIIRSTAGSPPPSAPRNLLVFSSAATPSLSDWRVMDLEFDGEGKDNTAVSAAGGFDQLTLMRLHIHDMGFGIVFSSQAIHGNNTALNTPHHIWNQLTVVDSTVQRIIGGAGAAGTFFSATRFAFMGNFLDDMTLTEHPMRIQFANRFVLSNNTMQGAPGPSGPAGSKETVTIRAPNSQDINPNGNPGGSGFQPFAFPPPGEPDAAGVGVTQKVVVSDNQIIISGFVGMDVKPVDNGFDTRFKDIIFERNWYYTPAAPAPTNAFSALDVRGDEVTVRNEIIDASRFVVGIVAENDAPGMAPTSNIRIYNNSIFSANTGNFIAIRLQSGVTGASASNNVAYAPSALGPNRFVVQNSSTGATICATCNSSNAEAFLGGGINPNWNITPAMTPADFTPSAGSYAIGTVTGRGILTPAFVDFFGAARPAGPPFDMGAVNP